MAIVSSGDEWTAPPVASCSNAPACRASSRHSLRQRSRPYSSRNAIADGIVSLARNLDLGVVAEGIERPVDRQVLIELGCPLGQGYLFARPMPAADALRWLFEHTRTGEPVGSRPQRTGLPPVTSIRAPEM